MKLWVFRIIGTLFIVTGVLLMHFDAPTLITSGCVGSNCFDEFNGMSWNDSLLLLKTMGKVMLVATGLLLVFVTLPIVCFARSRP